MPTIANQLSQRFAAAIQAAFGIAADPLVNISQESRRAGSDYQSNAAMSLAKTLGKKPREVAETIKSRLDLADMAQEVTIAGPGFINVKLSHAWLQQELQKLLADQRLGVEKVANPLTVVVDYSGPNVAKEMHVGHLRSTIIGDAISRVLEEQGHTVKRQNHVGDWGTQFGMLIEHLFDRFGKDQVLAATFEISDLNAFYQQAKAKFDADTEFAGRARQRVVKLQGRDDDTYASWRLLYAKSLEHFDEVYGRLDIQLKNTDIRGESFYNADLPVVVTELKKAGLAIESEGATAVFIDGPDKPPLIVEKTGGGYLYATTDLAAIRYRVKNLHAQRIIYVHDSRQAHHFAQLFATAKKAGWTRASSPSPGTPGEGRGEGSGSQYASTTNPNQPPPYPSPGVPGEGTKGAGEVILEFAPFGTMLGEDGKPFKTRSGETVKLKDLLDEAEQRALAVVEAKNPDLPDKPQIAHAVGIGGVKYSDLAKDRVADYVFSFDKMLSLDGNTAPYLQYAHARIRSIFRKAGDYQKTAIRLESPHELSLAKHILRLGEVIDSVARELKPHLLCTYLYDLATKFSGFYENCPVIQSQEPTKSSRLQLCDLTSRTMAIGLDLLGIQHPDQM
jgi:arginyl-tRNA synthetase